MSGVDKIRRLLCTTMGFMIGILLLDMIQDLQIYRNRGIQFYKTYYEIMFTKQGLVGNIIYGNIAFSQIVFIVYMYNSTRSNLFKAFSFLLDLGILVAFASELPLQFELITNSSANITNLGNQIGIYNFIIMGGLLISFALIATGKDKDIQKKQK